MNRLVPMLPVRSVASSTEFYRKLGFTTEDHHPEWGWAMLRLDECRLMLDQSINRSPGAARQSVIYLYPEDVVAYHTFVKESGLKIPDLEVTFYGMTEFRIEDPDGNRFWIGQQR
jgi:catechol 2,3-dioxygenase-like lactoylglutathione lyase family enzyme